MKNYRKYRTLRYIALSFFVIIPVIAFFLGIKYQENLHSNLVLQNNSNSPIFYTNTNWGFTLKFPSTWNGYLVDETDDLNKYKDPGFASTAQICFHFNRPTYASACILSISIFSTKQWQDWTNSRGGGKILGVKNNYYFISDNNIDNVNCNIPVPYDAFQCQRALEIKDINSTFKFTN
ncbi:MAG TPA: hypothetical protein VG895_05120 [Patescibacteria group bacterium]|nr:hypothetical protein [Patescibacteria group bacterium]